MSERILVLTSQMAGVGDLTLGIELYASLRRAHPGTPVDILTSRQAAPALPGNPYFDRALIYDRGWSFVKKLSFVRTELRKENYSLGICLSEAFSSLVLLYLARCRLRVGFDWNGRGRWLDVALQYTKPERYNIREYYRWLGEVLGLPPSPDTRMWSAPGAGERIEHLLKGKDLPRPWIVIHPGAGWPARRYPRENWWQVMSLLGPRTGGSFLITGSASEQSLCEELLRGYPGPALNLCGRTALADLPALFHRSDLFIGADSGPLHMASASDIAVVALYGPSPAGKYAPPPGRKGRVLVSPVHCRPCKQLLGYPGCRRGRPICMEMIEPGEVVRAALDLLEKQDV